jgi:hypothetical protein
MDFFSFNYKPSSFKGKTPEAILEMKSNKIDKDFFTKYNNENNEDFRELTSEMKGAIQLLIDLKHKVTIYNKCYKNSFPAEKPQSMRPKTMSAPAPMQEKQEQGQGPEPEDQGQAQEQMQGGGRRRRRRRGTKSKSKSKRSSKGKGKGRGKRTRKH